MKFTYLLFATSAALLACGSDDEPADGASQRTQGATASCEARSDDALKAVEQVLAGAARTCTRDADCSLVTASTRCGSACLHRSAVAHGVLGAVNEAIGAIDVRLCGAFATDAVRRCEPAVPAASECGLAQEAYCQAGSCARRLIKP